MRRLRNTFAGAAIVLAVVLAAGALPGGAQVPAPYVHVFVDGQPVAFDVPPQIDNGRVLVPLRGVFEHMGATAAWDDRTQTVLAQRGATSMSLVIGNTQAMINGQPAIMDVPAMLVGGRTTVPLRFVSDRELERRDVDGDDREHRDRGRAAVADVHAGPERAACGRHDRRRPVAG